MYNDPVAYLDDLFRGYNERFNRQWENPSDYVPETLFSWVIEEILYKDPLTNLYHAHATDGVRNATYILAALWSSPSSYQVMMFDIVEENPAYANLLHWEYERRMHANHTTPCVKGFLMMFRRFLKVVV